MLNSLAAEKMDKVEKKAAKQKTADLWKNFNDGIAGNVPKAQFVLKFIAGQLLKIRVDRHSAVWRDLAALMLYRVANSKDAKKDAKKVLLLAKPARRPAGATASDDFRLWIAAHEKIGKGLSPTAAIDAVHKEEVKKKQRKGLRGMPIAKKTIKNAYERLNRMYMGRKANKSVADYLAEIPVALREATDKAAVDAARLRTPPKRRRAKRPTL